MTTYDVTVTLALNEGYTVDDAELGSPAALKDHLITVEAHSAEQAEERALDVFHFTVPIGNLEAVDVSTRVEARPEGGSREDTLPERG
jgi:hypothetical protein